MNNITSMLPVYFIAGTQDCRHLGGTLQQNLLSVLESALQAGITCFQFREKEKGSLQKRAEILPLAIACRDLCRVYQVPFIMNNDVDLALEIEADGVHIGQSDRDIQTVINQCQGKLIIGLSVSTLAQAKAGEAIKAVDYFGVGPIFPTFSKSDANPAVGIEFVKQLRQNGITKPFVAIGGIKESDAKSILTAGANGIATISTIARSQNREKTIQTLKGER